MLNPYADFMRPAAPFVVVRIGRTVGEQTTDSVLAQLDTGADRTVIPVEFQHQLRLAPSGSTVVLGFQGRKEDVPIYDARLTISGFEPIAVEVLASIGEPWVLLGRDVLNRYRVILDGPNRTLEIT